MDGFGLLSRALNRIDWTAGFRYNSSSRVVPVEESHTVEKTAKTYYTSSVSPKGQITLPKQLRDELHIEPKDIVVIALEDGHTQIEKAESQLLSGFGIVPVPENGKSWKEIERDVFDDVAERNARKWLSGGMEYM
jgi:antitoxin PrlF